MLQQFTCPKDAHLTRIPSFHPDGELIAFAQGQGGVPTIVVWDTTLNQRRASLRGQPGTGLSSRTGFSSARFSRDGNRVLVPCEDGKIRIWDWRLEKELLALSDATQTELVAQSPDGAKIAYAGFSPSLRIATALPWTTQRGTDFYSKLAEDDPADLNLLVAMLRPRIENAAKQPDDRFLSSGLRKLSERLIWAALERGDSWDGRRKHLMGIADPGLKLAAAHALVGQNDAAIDEFRRLLAGADGYEAKKSILQVAAIFDDCLPDLVKQYPDDPQLLLAVARNRAARGKAALAVDEPDVALGTLKQAEEIFARLRSVGVNWKVLTPIEMTSENGSKLEVQYDGSVFVYERAKNDTYTLVFPSELKGIVGLRLEALADSRLPRGGPGWWDSGNFLLSELTLHAVPAESTDREKSIALRNATADFSQITEVKWDIRDVLVGDNNTGWAVLPEINKNHTAVFELAEQLGDSPPSRFAVRLHFQHPSIKNHNLGRFRLSFTNDATTSQATRVLLDLKDSELSDCYLALGISHARQGQNDEAFAAIAQTLPLITDRFGKARIISAAAPLKGVLEKLAKQAASDGYFQAELARHFLEQGDTKQANAARAKALTLFEEQLDNEPGNSVIAVELAELLLSDTTTWSVLKPIEMKSGAGATLTPLDDGSILIETPSQTQPEVVRWQPAIAPVQALRIETSAHTIPSTNGAPFFNEYQIVAASLVNSPQGTLRGRYVRLDLPGDSSRFPRHPIDGLKKSISLAELEVFQGDQNIAMGKATQQSSNYAPNRVLAARAVDGNTIGNDSTKSYAHTSFERNPWWEVDLGSDQTIDRMVVWNRNERDL